MDLSADDNILVIDAATPRVQVLHLLGGKLQKYASGTGKVAELISDLVEEVQCDIEDLNDVIFCCGPGSAIGIRSSMVSVKTWQIFLNTNLNIYEYDSLSMSLLLNPKVSCVYTYGVGEELLCKRRNSETIDKVLFKDVLPKQTVHFLDTRLSRQERYKNFTPVVYDIAKLNIHKFLPICRRFDGLLKSYTDVTFQKWSGQ